MTLSTSDLFGGGGGGGGGIGSRATLGTITNLGNGGSDANAGVDGSGYGLTFIAGSGGGGNNGGNNAGGGGGGAAGTGAYDAAYTVQGGSGGVGGGGGGGGVNQSGATPADGGSSNGGGGGGLTNGFNALGGVDTGNLGGGAGGIGANVYGSGFGGGGGGGGSGLGGAIFVDSNLNFTIQAFSGIATSFNTPNNTTQAGIHGTAGSGGGTDGQDGSALGNSIFLRTGSSLTFLAQDTGDILTVGDQVAFTDDTAFGSGGTSVFVKGNGTVIYNGTTDYQGTVQINNANFKVNGQINTAPILVCRNSSFSSQRGTLSGIGTLTGDIFANSGTISPDVGGTLTLGSLSLNSAASGSLGSLVHIEINSSGTSLVAVTGPASLAGILEIHLDANTPPGRYILLTSSGITGTFDSVSFVGTTPNYTISYLPAGAPTYVELNFIGYPSSAPDIPATVDGSPIYDPAVVCCGRPVILGPLPVPGPGPTVYTVTQHTGSVTCQIGQSGSQTYLKIYGNNGSCTIIGTKDGVVSNPLTVSAP